MHPALYKNLDVAFGANFNIGVNIFRDFLIEAIYNIEILLDAGRVNARIYLVAFNFCVVEHAITITITLFTKAVILVTISGDMIAFLSSPYYSFVKDVIYFLIAAAGLWVAWQGLFTWREQIKGHVEYETARRLYRAVLKLRDAMSYVRNPGIWPSESAEAEEKYPKEEKGTTNAVYRMRWEKMIDTLSELQAEQLEGEVLWGKEVIEKIKPMRACVTKLNIAISNMFRSPEYRVRSAKEEHEIIYEARYDEQNIDAFSKEIDAAVDSVGNYLKPKYKFSE